MNTIFPLLIGLCLGLALMLVAWWLKGSGSSGQPDLAELVATATDEAFSAARSQATAERDSAVKAALEQSAVLQREKVTSQLERQHEQFQNVVDATTQHLQAIAGEQLQRLSDAVGEQQKELASNAALQLEKATKVLGSHQTNLLTSVEAQREKLEGTAETIAKHATGELTSKKQLIDTRLEKVQSELGRELAKVTTALEGLGKQTETRFGQVESSIKSHVETTRLLSDSTEGLRKALANPQARGQWGERMAEDVLHLAGFVENVNYTKQSQIEGAAGRPDFTFPMPKGHMLYMDVKFPMAAYLRYLEAESDHERKAHMKQFLADVRAHVKELDKRSYATGGDNVNIHNVLLFIPNEQLLAVIHEQDPSLIDDAMGRKIVICSPLTLFAFLGVVRQAYDNFMIEQTSDQILQLLEKFDTQWKKYSDEIDKTERAFKSVSNSFDQLTGTRRRALNKPLDRIGELRRQSEAPQIGSTTDRTLPEAS